MKRYSKIFQASAILLTLWINLCTGDDKESQEQHDVFNIIIGDKDGYVTKTRSNESNLEKSLLDVPRAVMAMARDGDYIFVSNDNRSPGLLHQESYVYRCKMNWKEIELEDRNCRAHPFARVYQFDHEITSLAVMDDILIVGQSNGYLSRCSIKTTYCQYLYKANADIKGLAYDSENENLFVALNSGHLLMFPNGLYTEPVQTVYEINERIYHIFRVGFTAVHVAFDSLWLATENHKVLRCPLTTGEDDKLDCRHFLTENYGLLTAIQSKGEYLYASTPKSESGLMWRCNPDKPELCRFDFAAPQKDIRAFLIVD